MAIFEVQRKAEVWYTTTVEATTWEEAVSVADSMDQWEPAPSDILGIEFVDDWWIANEDTGEKFIY